MENFEGRLPYLLWVVACRNNEEGIDVKGMGGVFMGHSLEEAKRSALPKVMKVYPPSDGWQIHMEGHLITKREALRMFSAYLQKES